MALKNIEINVSDEMIMWEIADLPDDYALQIISRKSEVLKNLRQVELEAYLPYEQEEFQEKIKKVENSDCEFYFYEDSDSFGEIPDLASYVEDYSNHQDLVQDLKDDILDYAIKELFESENSKKWQKKFGFFALFGDMEDILSKIDKCKKAKFDRQKLESLLEPDTYYYVVASDSKFQLYNLGKSWIDCDYYSTQCNIIDQFVTQKQFDEVTKGFSLWEL